MGEIEKTLEELNALSAQLKKQVTPGYLILVDLVGSTAFKTMHPESIWLDRLIVFYKTVESSFPKDYIKYLGDGILIFFKKDKMSADAIVEQSRQLLSKLTELNATEQFLGDYAISVRIVLNFGAVYMLFDNDPQGTAVDKLFRMEKFVPDGHIGMTEEFINEGAIKNLKPVGYFFLKGLAAGRHALYLVSDTKHFDETLVENLLAESAAASLWWISGASDKPVYIVDGYIPPEDRESAVIQIGDKSAVIDTLYNLALSGGISNVRHYISPQFPPENIRGNIVCIGGPYYNSVTDRLMKDSHLPIFFEGLHEENDETPLVHGPSATKFEKSYDHKKRLVRDWGLFARFRNPYDKQSKVIVACGIESPAVEGIVKVFSPRSNPLFHKLYEHLIGASHKNTGVEELSNFCCIMPFDIEVATGTARLPSFDDQRKHIYWLS